MSQLIQHYQTSFVIEGNDETKVDMLYQAQYLIGEWVKKHENRRFHNLKRRSKSSFLIDSCFTKRANYSSNFSWCRTDYCLMEDSFAWSMEYTHRDDKVRDVFWVSEIGLRYFKNRKHLVIHVKISYKLSTEFALAGKPFSPDVSIPWCVEGLFETFAGCRFLSGEEDVTAGIRTPVKITDVEMAKRVLAHIESHERKLAVVLLRGETEEVYQEAKCLNKNLFAKALVYIVPYNVELNKILGRFRLEFNECMFIPTFRVDDSDTANGLRYFVTNRKAAETQRQIILKAWLGCHRVNEKGSVSNIENIQILIRRQKFLKIEAEIKNRVSTDEYEKVKTELREMSGLFDLSEAEKKEIEERNVQLKDRVGELESRNLDLEIEKQNLEEAHATEVYNIRATHESESRKCVQNDIELPSCFPNSFKALQQFAPFYAHLVFSEDAWTPAVNYRNFKDFEIAWEMLYALNHTLWELIFVKHGNIEHEFESLSKFQYARGEGKQTSNNARLAQIRKFEFNGKTYEMWTHIKYGNRPGK